MEIAYSTWHYETIDILVHEKVAGVEKVGEGEGRCAGWMGFLVAMDYKYSIAAYNINKNKNEMSILD